MYGASQNKKLIAYLEPLIESNLLMEIYGKHKVTLTKLKSLTFVSFYLLINSVKLCDNLGVFLSQFHTLSQIIGGYMQLLFTTHKFQFQNHYMKRFHFG